MEEVYIKTPLGIVKITGGNNGVTSIVVLNEVINISKKIPEPLKEVVMQLQEYFTGERTVFTFSIAPQGTAFQKQVWQALLQIPYGTTTSYLKLSEKLGDVKAIRAVAAANGKNPLWIVVPCHRVIGNNGSLIGYAGGLWRKQWLLEHEKAPIQQKLF